MRSSKWFIGVLALLAVVLALAGCAIRPTGIEPTLAPAADVSGLAQNMQGMMTGMQGMMQNLQSTPMSPEVVAQMQGVMAGMQGMMGNLQDMPMSPEMMQQMQSMMGDMQGMMAQMHGTATPMPMPGMPGMMGMMGNAPQVPAGLAYSEGQPIRFIHTEASDPEIAQLLSGMMGSPVLVAPSLAQVPASALAPVYVFTNGVAGVGPLGFQPDVFPFPPGATEYTPLRTIHLVTWADPAAAVELKSAADVQAAIAAGQLTEEVPGVVVNMPFVAWPGGNR